MLGFVLLSILIGCIVIAVIYIITEWLHLLGIFRRTFESRGDDGTQSELDQKTLLRGHGYDIGEKIGQGTYADVKKAYSIANKKQVAIKIVNKREVKYRCIVYVTKSLIGSFYGYKT